MLMKRVRRVTAAAVVVKAVVVTLENLAGRNGESRIGNHTPSLTNMLNGVTREEGCMKNADDKRGPPNPSHQAIEELAYQFWIMRGRPFGAPDYDWHEAERALNRCSSGR